MKSLIEQLSSPFLVAQFQHMCGVEWADPDEFDPLLPRMKILEDGSVASPSFVIKNRLLYYAFQLGSQLAGEPFYYVFLPACSWMLDIAVARKLVMKLSLVMYLGQSAKDILRRTRPPSPPVIRLEKMYETEYGMPSTHTMAGTVAPFALVVFSKQLYDIPVSQCMFAASLWTVYVGSSRIYLGMHTLWQVLAGAIGTGVLLHLSVQTVCKFDLKLLRSSTNTAFFVMSTFALSWVMFQLDSGLDPETGKPRWNSARGDTAEILGLCAGFITGSRWSVLRSLYLYRVVGSAVVPVPVVDTRSLLVRVAFGGLVLLPVMLLKVAFVRILAKIAGVSLKNSKDARKNPRIELPYKYAFGFAAGLVSTTVVPFVLNELQLW